MELTGFQAVNFRSLVDNGWIELSDLSIFTGENDGGKTATLDALEIFLNPKGAPTLDDYWTSGTSAQMDTTPDLPPITLQARFHLRDNERAILSAIWGLDEESIEILRVFTYGEPPPSYLLRAETYNDERFRKPLDDCTIPELKTLAESLGIDILGANLKQEHVDRIREWLREQPLIETEVELPDGLVKQLPEFQLFSSESALNPESEIKRILTTQFRELISSDKYTGPISEIENDIEEDLNLSLTHLGPIVKRYSEYIDAVSIRPQFNFASGLSTTQLQLSRDDGSRVLLDNSGAGQRRRLSLAVYEWSQEIFKNRDQAARQIIMAFDEPDTHLDYKSQREIFDVIRHFADLPAMQVIICTHSLNLIERVPIDRIVHFRIMIPERRTSTEVLQISDHETTELFMYELSVNMGLRNSIMLHERCFMAIEGQTELQAIPVLFHKLFNMPLQSAGICLINGENNYGARMVTKFLNSNRKEVVFLVDTEAQSTPGTKRQFTPAKFIADGIDEGSQVFYVGDQEFEDSFSNDVWVRFANQYYPKTSGDSWEADDFEALRTKSKFSREIQEVLKNEAGLQYIPPKPDIGYHLSRTVTRDEIPQQIIDCLTEANSRANI